MKRGVFQKGFTLVEVLVVLVVLLIITTIILTSLFSLRKAKALEQNTEQTASLIREAQTATIASLNATTYGIVLSSTNISLFSGSPSNVVKQFTLTDSVVLNIVSGSSTIEFERFTGKASTSTTFTLSRASQSGTSTFILSPTGTLTINRTP